MEDEEIRITEEWGISEKIERYIDATPEREIDEWYDFIEEQDWLDNHPEEEFPSSAEFKALAAEIREDEALRKMPEDPTSSKTYDQQLQEAAESGKFRQQGPDKGRDR